MLAVTYPPGIAPPVMGAIGVGVTPGTLVAGTVVGGFGVLVAGGASVEGVPVGLGDVGVADGVGDGISMTIVIGGVGLDVAVGVAVLVGVGLDVGVGVTSRRQSIDPLLSAQTRR